MSLDPQLQTLLNTYPFQWKNLTRGTAFHMTGMLNVKMMKLATLRMVIKTVRI